MSAIPSDLCCFFFLRLNRCNSFSRYRASLADSYTDRRKELRKEERERERERPGIDPIGPIFATHIMQV